MSRLQGLQQQGQSVWLDFIKRSLITSGELERLIRDDGVRGLTSNPSIFEQAIGETSEYTNALQQLSARYADSHVIYEQLAIADIQAAADTFRSVYDDSKGRDGFVSLEVSPELVHDTRGTLTEARRLWRAVGRDNLMIKVPGTPEGIAAIESLVSEGINVNVTLLFAVDVYQQVANSYIAGLSRLAAEGGKLQSVASVASFFISRVNTMVDKLIHERLATATGARLQQLEGLLGKAAIANAKLAYAQYQDIYRSAKWQELAARGARTQRVLWASTGTKNPTYRDVVYVEQLVGPDTVNTMPPATMNAFRDHGVAETTLTRGLDEARQVVAGLETVGISMAEVTSRLLEDGQQQFNDAFRLLLSAVDRARQAA